jgi:hypothetical protein
VYRVQRGGRDYERNVVGADWDVVDVGGREFVECGVECGAQEEEDLQLANEPGETRNECGQRKCE